MRYIVQNIKIKSFVKKLITSEKKVIAVLKFQKIVQKININIEIKFLTLFRSTQKKLIIVYPKIKSKIILGFKMGIN